MIRKIEETGPEGEFSKRPEKRDLEGPGGM